MKHVDMTPLYFNFAVDLRVSGIMSEVANAVTKSVLSRVGYFQKSIVISGRFVVVHG